MIAGNLVIRIGGDLSGYAKAIGETMAKSRAMSQQLRSIGTTLTASLTLPIIGAGAAAIKVASDVEEMRSKFNAVFKNLSSDVEQWAKTHADSIGRSHFDLMNYAADIQDTFVPLGFAREQAAEMSKAVVELSEDLASFKNLRTEEVVRGLTSALVGNVENLRQFGVVANEAQIKQKALQLGIIKTTKDALDPQQKALAIWQLTLDGTTDAQGDALRTAGSFANRMKALQGTFRDFAADIGTRLLPLAQRLVTAAEQLLGKWEGLDDSVKNSIIRFGLVAAAIGPLALAMSAVLTPIGLTTVAIASVAAAAYLIYDAWKDVPSFWEGIWNSLKYTAAESAVFILRMHNLTLGWIPGIGTQVGVALKAAETAADDLGAKIPLSFDKMEDGIRSVWSNISSIFEQVKKGLDELGSAYNNVTNAPGGGGGGGAAAARRLSLTSIVPRGVDVTSGLAPAGAADPEALANKIFELGKRGKELAGAFAEAQKSGRAFRFELREIHFDSSALEQKFQEMGAAWEQQFGAKMQSVLAVMMPALSTLGQHFESLFESIVSGVDDGVGAMRKLMAGLVDTVRAIITAVKAQIIAMLAVDAATKLISGNIVGALVAIGKAAAITAALSAAEGILAGGIKSLTRPPEETRIPALAAGGIVRRPTLALIGEAGPEAVVPLRNAGMLNPQLVLQGSMDVSFSKFHFQYELWKKNRGQ